MGKVEDLRPASRPSAFDMCWNHFKGPVKDRFLEISRDFQSETLENYEEAIEKIKKHFLPPRCYLRMRRGLRRDPSVNKPMGSTTRKWAARVQEYNSLLLEIPGSRGKLDDDELIEIIEFGLPRSWCNKFIEHNFDTSQKTIIELVEFCERLEALKVCSMNLLRHERGRPNSIISMSSSSSSFPRLPGISRSRLLYSCTRAAH